MSKIPKFSIVTPSYNQCGYISETIESVLSQVGDFEIEYFVMDGGSTDGSVEIIRSYADKVKKKDWSIQCKEISMYWISQRDKGQSDAINKGLRQSTGDILSYINSDDLYYPGAFAQVVKAFYQHPTADLIYGDGEVIDDIGNLQWEWLSRPYNHRVMTSYHFLWNDFTNYILQQATFWRKDVMDKIGYFDETFHYAMDVEYWIRAGHSGVRLQHIPQKLGKFRLIKGTKSLSSPTVFWEDHLEIYRRYRGSQAMGIFFAYYYYNLARQTDFDLEQAIAQGKEVFARWQSLTIEEQREIANQAQRGVALACLLLAGEFYGQQRYARADLSFKAGVARHRWLVLHPFGLAYIFKRFIGSYLSTVLDKWKERLIRTYRRKHYDYRYYQIKKTTGAF